MATTLPPMLEYGQPAPVEGRGWEFGVHLLRWGTVTGLISLVLAGIVPRFEQMFRDFKVELAWPSQIVLAVSNWFVGGYGWAAVAPVPFLLAYVLCLPRRTPEGRRSLYRVERLAAFLITAAFLVFVIVALFMPFSALIQALSSSRGGR